MRNRKYFLGIGLACSILVPSLIACTTVDPGHAAVEMDYQGQMQQLGEGVWSTPCCVIDDFDLRQRNWSAKFESITADGMPVYTSESVVTYQINKDELLQLERSVGPNFEKVLIGPTIQSAIRNVIGKYRWDELDSEGLQRCQEEITSAAKIGLEPYHLILEQVEIRNILSRLEKFNEEVNETSVMEQAALEANIRVKIARDRAKERIQEAQGIVEEFKSINPSLNSRTLAESANSAWEHLLTSPLVKVDLNDDNHSKMEEILP